MELLTWFKQKLREMGLEMKIWLAVDGAYATRPFLLPVLGLDIVVVSRLRKDACLHELPGPRPPHQRGPDPIYGKNKIALAKRAASAGLADDDLSLPRRRGDWSVQDVPRDLET